MTLIWSLLIFVLKLNLLLAANTVTVTIPDGTLKGTVNQTLGNNVTFNAFRGIPYAQAPVGDLRFANPVKNDAWNGTLDATQDKSICTQSSSSYLEGDGVVRGSEDCLYINVYTTNVSASLPVIVFFYGGGFKGGSSTYASYPPDYILEKDVVFVSFNYRVGVFGFLSTEDVTCPGNWGLKDQILALKWVQDNIEYFGGNSSEVTIFGQSAGGAAVSYLVQSDLTAGLYRSAIISSGSSLCLWALTKNARNKAFDVAANLGIYSLNTQTLIEQLRLVDYQELTLAEDNVTLAALLSEGVLVGQPFGIVQEPDISDAVFINRSHVLLENGDFQRVPLLIGFTANEGGAWQLTVGTSRPSALQYDIDFSKLAPSDLTPNVLKRMQAGFEVKNNYFTLASIATQPDALIKLISVEQWNRPIREHVRLASAFTNVYYYQFSYNNSSPTATYQGDDLNYYFSTDAGSDSESSVVRDRIITMWTNFVKTGNPTPEDDTLLENVTWEPNTSEDDTDVTIKYLNINDTLTMDTNPGQSDFEFYKDLYDRLGEKPYTTY